MIDDTTFIVWASVSLVVAAVGGVGLARTQRMGLALLFTYCLSQPLSWTVLVIGNGGGSIIAPIPDLVAVYLFFTGVVEYRVERGSINACFPPSPVSSAVAFALVFLIARRFKRVAYHRVFRKAAQPR